MQYLVPRFIEEETKVLGNLSLRQVLILGCATAVVLTILSVRKSILLSFVTAVFVGVPAFFLAFGRINGEPVPRIILLAIKFLSSAKLYKWEKGGKEAIFLREYQVFVKEKKKKFVPQESKIKKISFLLETGKIKEE